MQSVIRLRHAFFISIELFLKYRGTIGKSYLNFAESVHNDVFWAETTGNSVRNFVERYGGKFDFVPKKEKIIILWKLYQV